MDVAPVHQSAFSGGLTMHCFIILPYQRQTSSVQERQTIKAPAFFKGNIYLENPAWHAGFSRYCCYWL